MSWPIVTRGSDSPRGVRRMVPTCDSKCGDLSRVLTAASGSQDFASASDEKKSHSKFFFRLTKRLLRRERSISFDCSPPNENDKQPSKPAECRTSKAKKLRRVHTTETSSRVPLFTSCPETGKFGQRSVYDQVRAEAVSLTYTSPMIATSMDLASMGYFGLDKPPSNTKLTLILDLDDTLVHTIFNYSCFPSRQNSARRVNMKHSMTVFYRPFVIPFLHAIKKMQCEVIVFTAGTKSYSDTVLDVIDPEHELINHRLYRQHASGHPSKPNMLCKNLQLLGRDLDRCLLIDDTPESYCLQPMNGWPISSYGKRLSSSDIVSIVQSGTEDKYRQYSPPVILEGRSSRPGIANKLVVACNQQDCALLNALYLMKELLKSNLTVPEYTQIYEKRITGALLTTSHSLFVPHGK
eukprot:Gregarina_sp_Poly_1__10802@NODE_831_length_6095_cov_272_214167_g601_i0_p2_GENE_NODE_831_length_6095_cov_272_214167_g601_i0NODE_831_length_6095_cov_272_214167_g601_i0_p2_ORF_typecomplete_len408_score24_76NIF/PF03031_18/4_3e34HAD_2/PF13419_6/0_00071Acid_phosphat_B/PF03767_14/0_21_NODE_831_length_6095_cov_272_214167_g601_i013882611